MKIATIAENREFSVGAMGSRGSSSQTAAASKSATAAGRGGVLQWAARMAAAVEAWPMWGSVHAAGAAVVPMLRELFRFGFVPLVLYLGMRADQSVSLTHLFVPPSLVGPDPAASADLPLL